MNKISIITPFKKAENYIVETAHSIFNQSHKDWEWILINDSSEGNEEELLKDFIADNKVTLLQNEGNGIINALNTGFQKATGTYITRMDADDLMPENKLYDLLEGFKQSSCDIVTGKVSYFSENKPVSEGYLKYEKWLNRCVEKNQFYEEIYRECTLASGNWLMKRDTLSDCGGFNNLEYPEDYDLLFRWYEYKLKICGVPQITHLWREHPERTSRSSIHYSQEYFFRLKIKAFIRLDYNKNNTLVLNATGKKARLTAKMLLEYNIPFHWVSLTPEKFEAGIYGKKILSPEEIVNNSSLDILNASFTDKQKLASIYKKKNKINRIFLL